MMTRTLTNIFGLVAAAALAGCSNENHNIVGSGPDEGTPTNAATTNIQLPPSIASSKTYRCADNNLVYVDWMSDQKSANVRTQQGGAPTQVTATDPGKPMTGPAGYSVSGSASASSATIAVPGHPAQSCKA
jgi:hypothetical protein